MLLRRTVIAVVFVFAFFAFTQQILAHSSYATTTVNLTQDTTTILQNPMMGFQDEDVTRTWYPSSTSYMRAYSTCLQNGTKVGCGPLMWDKLNPQKGVYNFSDLDLFLSSVKSQNRFAGFRIRTVVDTSNTPTVPVWAASEGVTTSWGQEPFGGRSGVEIDYQKCIFLDDWGQFINQLVSRYDNNPQVSFIDIGGYGWYGEWWSGKTVLQRSYSTQIIDSTDPTQQQSLDTRTRIIRMFTGGSGSGHCVNNSGQDVVVSYSYPGFKNKPVLMSRGDQEDVQIGVSNGTGVRYDAVGASNDDFRAKVGSYIAQVWQTKPIMGEFAGTSSVPRNSTFLTRSLCFAREYHLSSIHNNDSSKPAIDMSPLYRELGYRISLNTASYPASVPASSQAQFSLTWINKGTSPAYTRYPLTLYFKPKGVDQVSAKVLLTSTDIRKVLPAGMSATSSDYSSCTKAAPTAVTVNETVTIPALTAGTYDMYFSFNEPVYQNPIQLALTQKDSAGRYLLGQITVQTTATQTNTPLPQPIQATATVTGNNGSPYGGNAATLPGRIQAENFNTGGEGVAYHDTDASNQSGQYRTAEGVDIENTPDTGLGYHIAYIRANEWLKYTVNVTTAGTYTINFRIASGKIGGTFHLEIDGVNATGSLNVPNTGSYQTWVNISKTGVPIQAGQHVLRVVFDTAPNTYIGYFNWFEFILTAAVTNTPAPTFAPPTNTPLPTLVQATNTAIPTSIPTGTPLPSMPTTGSSYTGTDIVLPGRIEAEYYNLGGEGIAYHDFESANQGGQYRTSEGVDVSTSADTGGGYYVGWTRSSEWLNYAVNVTTAGTYTLNLRVASAQTGGTFHVEIDGTNVTGLMTMPNTGGSQIWTTVSKTGIALSAGPHVVRLYMDNLGGNFNWFEFIAG